MKMKKTIDLGKYAYNGNKKVNRITIDIELTENNILSIWGTLWDTKGLVIIDSGQYQNEINNIIEIQANESTKALWNVIYFLWEHYNLNDMHKGTPEQEKLLEQNPNRSYNNNIEFLKQHNMFVVPAEQADPYRKTDSMYLGETMYV